MPRALHSRYTLASSNPLNDSPCKNYLPLTTRALRFFPIRLGSQPDTESLAAKFDGVRENSVARQTYNAMYPQLILMLGEELAEFLSKTEQKSKQRRALKIGVNAVRSKKTNPS